MILIDPQVTSPLGTMNEPIIDFLDYIPSKEEKIEVRNVGRQIYAIVGTLDSVSCVVLAAISSQGSMVKKMRERESLRFDSINFFRVNEISMMIILHSALNLLVF